MKKRLLIFVLLGSLLLSGCSFLGEVNQSLDYATEATEYINTLSDFANEAPQMFQDASVNLEVKEELEAQLNQIIQKTEEFNQTDPPAIAEGLHEQFVSKNELILEDINQIMDNGEILLDQLENTQIVNTINEVTLLLDQLEEIFMN